MWASVKPKTLCVFFLLLSIITGVLMYLSLRITREHGDTVEVWLAGEGALGRVETVSNVVQTSTGSG